MPVAKDIMTREVITVSPDMGVDELANMLWEKKISGAPVVDNTGNLLGVVTESDLIDQTKKVHIPTVMTILDSMIFLENPAKLDKEIKKMTGSKVGDICSADPVTVNEETSVEEIATIMADKNVHTIPVIKNGGLIGIIGKSDIIKILFK